HTERGRGVKKRMEPMKMLVSAMMALSLAAGAARPQPAPHSILGKWYGMKEGSPMTVEFRQDGTAIFKVDADSNASYTCRYRVDERASPVALDLLGIRPKSFNMQCAAVVVFYDRGELEIFGNLGAPGRTARPKAIDPNSPRFDVLYLKLSRDSRVI